MARFLRVLSFITFVRTGAASMFVISFCLPQENTARFTTPELLCAECVEVRSARSVARVEPTAFAAKGSAIAIVRESGRCVQDADVCSS